MKGIGGWLALFIVGNLVLAPLWAFSDSDNYHASQIIQKVPAAATVLNVEKAITNLVVLMGMVASVLLLRTKDSKSLRATKVYLLATPVLVGVLLVVYSLVDLPHDIRISVLTGGIGNLGKVSGYSLIWFLYFANSKRVRSTYLQSGEQAVLNGKWALIPIGVTFFALGIAVFTFYRATNADSLMQRLETLSSDSNTAADKAQLALTELRKVNLAEMRTASDVAVGLSVVENTQELEQISRAKSKELADFIIGNKEALQTEGASAVVLISDMYVSNTYAAYHDALKEFLNRFKELLTYVSQNFGELNDPLKMRRYLVLETAYKDALEKQNKVYYQHQAFIEKLATEHPELRGVLPTKKSP